MLRSPAFKSCLYKTGNSFQGQITRLNMAGFPKHVTRRSAQKLIKVVILTVESRKDGVPDENLCHICTVHHMALKMLPDNTKLESFSQLRKSLASFAKWWKKKLSGQKY